MIQRPKQSIENLIVNGVLQKFYTKETKDFLTMPQCNIGEKVTNVTLQCEGYAIFEPQETLKNFIAFFQKLSTIISTNKNIVVHFLKIKVCGFKITNNMNCFQRISKCISKLGQYVKNLIILTSDLESVTLKDFYTLFELITGMGVTNNANFEDFTLQCSNWVFEKKQPTWKQVQSVFAKLIEQDRHTTQLHQNHIRIQISGWWYRAAEAVSFLKFRPSKDELKKIPKQFRQNYGDEKQQFKKQQFNAATSIFHSEMQLLISKLLQILPNIRHFQIDMRNNHQLLQMKKLKQRLNSNVKKSNCYQKSIISMRQTNQNNEQNQKQLRLQVTM